MMNEPEKLHCIVCGWTGTEADITETLDLLLDDGSCQEAEVCPACGAHKYNLEGSDLQLSCLIAADVP